MYNTPIEEGNVKFINKLCLPITPLTLLRYEAVSDFYSEEPRNIKLKKFDNDNVLIFEQVLRFRYWIPNEKTFSWIIYSNSREWINEDGATDGLILRHVIWERNVDIKKVREIKKLGKKELVNNWPQLKATNIYINSEIANKLIDILVKGDKIISQGIILKERDSTSNRPIWRDMEYRRLFDWGNIQALWSQSMENVELEKYCFLLNQHLERYTYKKLEEVYQMDLDFIYPPDSYKEMIFKQANKM